LTRKALAPAGGFTRSSKGPLAALAAVRCSGRFEERSTGIAARAGSALSSAVASRPVLRGMSTSMITSWWRRASAFSSPSTPSCATSESKPRESRKAASVSAATRSSSTIRIRRPRRVAGQTCEVDRKVRRSWRVGSFASFQRRSIFSFRSAL
jgi:hypothetical protein